MQPTAPLAVAAALALGAPLAALAQTPAVAEASFRQDGAVAAGAGLEFVLAAALPPGAGQVTLIINGNDVGNFLQTVDGRHFVLPPERFPLPAGTATLELWFEPRAGEPVLLLKAEVAIRDASGASGVADRGLPADATTLVGAGAAGAGPAAGQVGSAPPAPGWTPRATVQASTNTTSRRVDGTDSHSVTRELAAQLGLRYEGPDDGQRIAVGTNLSGNSQRAKAVRFGTAGPGAQKIDINDYLVEFQTAAARLSLGTASVAGNPLLGQSFDHRGVSGALRIGQRLDIALTSQSSTALVGANPLTGVGDAYRRLTAATVGWEGVPEQPGALRLEATGLTARLDRASPTAGGATGATTADIAGAAGLPPAPGTGAAPQAERSHGAALRLLWQPTGSMLRLDTGYARSTSVQAGPFGAEQTASGRQAYYLDLSARVTDTAPATGLAARRLVLRLRHDFADTGYRSLAGGVVGDVRRTTLIADGQWRGMQGQLSHSRARNNASRIAGLPTLETVSDALNMTLPLALVSGAAPSATGSLWPTLQTTLQSNRQAAVQIPDTVQAALVPSMATRNASLNAQWKAGAWGWSVGATSYLRDNRQPGFEQQDQRTRGAQAQLQWQATPALLATLDLRRSRATALDTGTAQMQSGGDASLSWQLDPWSLSAQIGRHGDRDSLVTLDNRGRSWALQASRNWTVQMGPQHRVPVQLSLRLQQQHDRSWNAATGTAFQSDQRTRLVGLLLTATL